MLEDHDRIARDLHDHVVQRLFASALGVQTLVEWSGDAVARERLARIVAESMGTTRQIRTTIFALWNLISTLLENVRQVARGRSLLDPAVTRKLVQRLRAPERADPMVAGLTVRELEVADLIADGCTQPPDRRAAVPGRGPAAGMNGHVVTAPPG